MIIKIRRFLLAATIASGLCSSFTYQKTNAHDFPLRSVACPYADHSFGSTGTYCPTDDCQTEAAPPSVGLEQSAAMLSNGASFSMLRQQMAGAAGSLASLLNQWDQWQTQLANTPLETTANDSKFEPSHSYVSQPEIGMPPAPRPKVLAEIAMANALPSQLADQPYGESNADDQSSNDSLSTSTTTSPEFSDAIADEDTVADESRVTGQTVLVRNPFAAGISEEYAPYDFDARDSHWLPGKSRAWDWKSSITGRLAKNNNGPIQQIAVAELDSLANLPMAIPVASCEYDICKPESSCPQEVEAAEIIESGDAPAINLREIIGHALNALDDFACQWHSELHDLHGLENAGHWLGSWNVAESQALPEEPLEVAESNDPVPTSSIIPPLMYVLYTTTDGVDVVVPADMARAWDVSSQATDDLTVDRSLAESASEPALDDSIEGTESLPEIDFSAIRTKFLIDASAGLDWLGIRLLQAADALSDWAEPQIAKSPSPAIR